MATTALVPMMTALSSPDLTAIRKMPSDELHREIVQTYCALGENVLMYQALVLNARERMLRGEKVGDCLTWTEYADDYLRRIGESLSTCLRRLARAIEGVNPATAKFDSSGSRRKTEQPPLIEVEAKKEREIRSAVGLPKEKPVTVQLVKSFDAGWRVGYHASSEVEESNREIARKRNPDECPHCHQKLIAKTSGL